MYLGILHAILFYRDFFGTENPFADLLGASCVPVDFFAGTDENTGFKAKEVIATNIFMFY